MSKAAAAKDAVCGIERSKLDPKAIDEALKKLDIIPAPGTTLEKKVEILAEEFRTNTPQTSMSDPCSNCGAESDLDRLDVCPYCGEGGIAGETREPEPSDESGEVENEDDDEEPAADNGDGPGEPVAAPESPADPEQKLVPARRAKKSKAPKEKPSTALAKAPTTAMTAAPAKMLEELDRQVDEIKKLDKEQHRYTWMLALKLHELAKKMTWKARLTDDGKVKYRTFEEFADAELDITREFAQLYARIIDRGFTEKQVVELGPTKLRSVLWLPPAVQQKALTDFEGGASRREVDKKYRPHRPKAPPPTKAKKSKKSAPTERSDGKLTIALASKKYTLPAFKKPEGRNKEQVPAKKLADAPWALLELENDVRVWVTMAAHPKTGQLHFVLDVRRVQT